MYTLLMIIYVVLSLFLMLFIYIQSGKGDMGLGGLSRGSQTLFGGSGGQEFFEKVTWVLGAMFMLGALWLGVVKSRGSETLLSKYVPAAGVVEQEKEKPAENK